MGIISRVIRSAKSGYLKRYIMLNVPPISIIYKAMLRRNYYQENWLNKVNKMGRKIFLESERKLTNMQKKAINDLKQNGIAVLNFSDLFSESEFEELRKLAENWLEKQDIANEIKNRNVDAVGEGKQFQIRPFTNHPVFDANNKLMTISINDKILDIVSEYMEIIPRLKNVQLWYNLPVKGLASYSQNWHKDPEDKKMVKVFLNIRDVDEDSGPFHYVKKTNFGGELNNKFEIKPFQGVYPKNEEVERFKDSIFVGTGKAGTIVFCDTIGVHKGGYCKKKPRYLLMLSYGSNAANFKNKYSVLKDINLSKFSKNSKYVLGME